MRRMTVSAIAAALCFVGGLSAQEKPNFSGKWTNMAPTPALGAGGSPGLCGQECTIAQDAATLTITRAAQPQADAPPGSRLLWDELKSIHKFDVTESHQSNGAETVRKAMWEGAKLIITNAINVKNPPSVHEAKSTLSMNAGLMEVEESRTGSPPTKRTYKKN